MLLGWVYFLPTLATLTFSYCLLQFAKQNRFLPGRRSLDTVVTFLENSSKSYSESVSQGHSRPALSALIELTNSKCPPLYSRYRGCISRPLHSMLKHHQNWPSSATALPTSGSLNAFHSTWRDPHFEFYLVSQFNLTPFGSKVGVAIITLHGNV